MAHTGGKLSRAQEPPTLVVAPDPREGLDHRAQVKRPKRDAFGLSSLTANLTREEMRSVVVRAFLEDNGITVRPDAYLAEVLDRVSESEFSRANDTLRRPTGRLTLADVEFAFESLVDPLMRRSGGVHYTPPEIVRYILDEIVDGPGALCDPSCGSGAFLVEAAAMMSARSGRPMAEVVSSFMYGVDSSQDSIACCRLLLTLGCLRHGESVPPAQFNLRVGDSLGMDWPRAFPEVFAQGGFRFVVGNPPYVKIQHMPITVRLSLPKRWSTVRGGSHNLYIPFIELGASLLNVEGRLGYIVSSMFFKSMASEALREFLQRSTLVRRIVDFGDAQLFSGRTTYTCILELDRSRKSSLEYARVNGLEDLRLADFSTIPYETLRPRKWRLLSTKERDNVSKIEAAGLALGDLADIDTGLATLADKLFVIQDAQLRDGRYVKEFEGKTYKIEPAVTRPLVKVSDIVEGQDASQFALPIIFPYKSVEPRRLFTEEALADEFPGTLEYLRAIRSCLESRDKGRKKYETWYAFGRTQGLKSVSPKLLSPTFASSPRFALCSAPGMLFCNGYSVSLRTDSQRLLTQAHVQGRLSLQALASILNSAVMNYYIRNTSYVIEGGYYCYQRQFIETFGVPDFSPEEIRYLETTNEQPELDDFLLTRYGIRT
jgi:adenine-specific DNA-methyltransferase